jgi:hypothetical protein
MTKHRAQLLLLLLLLLQMLNDGSVISHLYTHTLADA